MGKTTIRARVHAVVGDLRLQVESMRRIAADTETSMRGETDPERVAFFDGRVCCLREQAMNIEDVIANASMSSPCDERG